MQESAFSALADNWPEGVKSKYSLSALHKLTFSSVCLNNGSIQPYRELLEWLFLARIARMWCVLVLKPLTFRKLGDGVCESLNAAGQVPRILLDVKPQFLGAVELRLHILMKLCPKTITGSLESNVQDQTDNYTKLKNTHLRSTQDPVEWDQ